MQYLHKHIARLVLISSACLLTSVYGYYYACEWMAKWAFAHQSYFAADELILLTIPQTDLSPQNEFLVNEGEFEWQGEMVDVIHRELRSDTLYIYGFRDKAETELKKQAAWLYSDAAQTDNQPLSSRSHTKRIKWFSPFVLPHSGEITPAVGLILLIRQSLFVYSLPRVRLPFLDVLSPPPNF